MKNQEFDHLLSKIRGEKIDDAAVEHAASRVWSQISGSDSPQGTVQKPQVCDDFQALIPAYLAHRLSEARTLLFEDHTHQCVACRQALGEARHSATRPIPHRLARHRLHPVLRWAMATLAIGMGIGVAGVTIGLLPGRHTARASVLSVNGSLFCISDRGVRPISAGFQILDGDEVLTGKGSDAIVRLLDGSRVEMDERTNLFVSRRWTGTTIHLDRGHIIVQAAPQWVGRLYVATDDCRVSVKGTVFSVHHGIKGSRISVMEGVVRVEHGRQAQVLGAGDETTTTSSLTDVPIQNEIAWSKNAAQHLALLGEFAILRKQIEAIPKPGLRNKPNLLPYVPDNTVMYAAIPNIGTSLTEAKQVFEERLRQSPVLREWWTRQQRKRGPGFQDMIDRLVPLSSYLGDEIIFAVESDGAGGYRQPVALAEVRQPGLRVFLENQTAQINPEGGLRALRVVDSPQAAVASPARDLLVYMNNNLVAVTADAGELQRVAALMKQPAAGGFIRTSLCQQIAQSYQQGVGWLLLADMEQIVAGRERSRKESEPSPPGLGNLKYLLMERRETGGKTESEASLTFSSEREGIASWLATPGPMGSLDFISPDAGLVAAFVTKNPTSIMEELFQFIHAANPKLSQQLSDFESRAGVSVVNDITGPLGGEATFALDGPILPTPSWKLVFEVYDPERLQSTISTLVASYNQQHSPDSGKLELIKQQAGSGTFFLLRNSKQPGSEVDYTFEGSYLIAAPNQALLARAIQERQTGYTLPRSQAFQAQLPTDGYTDFSAILYHNLGASVGPLVQQLKKAGVLTPSQEQSVDALTTDSTPGLIYAYGEPDRIRVASSTGFMGLNLDMLMGISQNRRLLPPRMFGGSRRHRTGDTQRQ